MDYLVEDGSPDVFANEGTIFLFPAVTVIIAVTSDYFIKNTNSINGRALDFE